MTSRWHTCFSLLAAAAALQAATVSGRVELRDSREKAVRNRSDFSGAVLSLWPERSAPPAAAPGARARMIQKNKSFQPHVLAVQVGTTVEFPNYDPIFHNAFSNYDGQIFDLGLYPPGSTRDVLFRRPGAVRIFCNIHATMSAVIVVLPTPYFAVTARDGSFEISGVPPGEYTLRVFHERATPATLAALERRVEVRDAQVALGRIAVSEAGYLPVPHKNKYGRPYDPAPDESGVYPAARR